MKNLRPDLNVEDSSSEPVLRGKVYSGVLSGAYGDQKAVDNDTFVNDARIEALERKGMDLNLPRQPATAAASEDVLFTGTPGAEVPAGTTLRYLPTGVLYSVSALVTLDGGGEGHGAVTCNVTGQIGNILAGGELTFDAPPPGIDAAATLVADMSSGSNQETVDSYRARILSRLQRPPAGGNMFDYPNFAFLADPSVRSALVRRFGRGLGTVDIYITTGTTDVDTAIDQGLPILRIPGSSLIAKVQEYYNNYAPLTDMPRVYAPTEREFAVTVKATIYPGLTPSYVPADSVNNPLGLTVAELVEREVARVLYKVPVGGRRLPGLTKGYMVASDIEAQLDKELSGVTDPVSGLFFGKIPVLVDRQVQPLDPPNMNIEMEANELAKPGVVSIIWGTI